MNLRAIAVNTTVAFALAFPITACSDKTTDSEAPRKQQKVNPKLRKNFIGGCIEGGSTEATCECLLDDLEKKYSSDEIIAIEQIMLKSNQNESEKKRVGDFMADVMQSAKVCVPKKQDKPSQ